MADRTGGEELFEERDRDQLAGLGVSVDEVRRQIRLFEHPPAYIRLDRPCRLGDGIRTLGPDDAEHLGRYEQARASGRLQRFVPASGAASRMFQTLLWARNECAGATRSDLEARAAAGNENAREVLTTLDSLNRFAFHDDLHAALREQGRSSDVSVDQLLDTLLFAPGLDCAARAKGLIEFHRYPEGSRTAFEEHLVEAASYLRDGDGLVRVHFTVSPEHLESFRALLDRVRPACEERCCARFEVGFSVQKRSTDTVAVDPENHPFRTADGRLLFRPGGHGALIENLNDLEGDVVHLQNIDNIVPDRFRDRVIGWKRRLIGEFLSVQERLFRHVAALADGASGKAREAALAFAAEILHVEVPERVRGAGGQSVDEFLLAKLNRPLRICGVVPNTGEPGGGPFWVRDREEGLSLQIVESAQVDPSSEPQQALFASSTHFNPVHIVCGVRDWRGRPFDLRRHVDPEAVFIAHKSKDGRPLKALERPGLWNGAMADWNTVFVEIDGINFTPVKTINDLLRPEHQPAD